MGFDSFTSKPKGRLSNADHVARENAVIRCEKGHPAWLQKDSGCTHQDCKADAKA